MYAPTLSTTSDAKDELYDKLAASISSIPSKILLVFLGDFSARLGTDHTSWPSGLGQFGVCKMNDNGQRLLELCTYYNLCECSDCNNYRGILLLSTTGKVFAQVTLARLQKLAKRVYPEWQCGFRAERSVDMNFSLRQLQEKCTEQQMPLYVTIWPRCSTSSTERASSKSCQRLAAHPSCRAWLSPSTATCKGLCSSVAVHLSPNRSNRAAHSLPLSSGSSSLSFWSRHSAHHKKGSTSVRDQMAGFSISPASEPWPKYDAKPSSETCCLLTMRQ